MCVGLFRVCSAYRVQSEQWACLCKGNWLHRLAVEHTSLSIYVFLRGLTLLVRCGNKAPGRGILYSLLAPTRMLHGDTLLMSLACTQILYCFALMPHTMPRSYVNFILRHSQKAPYVWNAIRVSQECISPVDYLLLPCGNECCGAWCRN